MDEGIKIVLIEVTKEIDQTFKFDKFDSCS